MDGWLVAIGRSSGIGEIMNRVSARGLGAALIALIIAGSSSLSCGDEEGGPSEPKGTPPLGLGLTEDNQPETDAGESIDYAKPLAEPFEIEIGGTRFVLPVGAAAVEALPGLPAVDITTGEVVGEPGAHPHYWLVTLHSSSLKVDASTGEVLDWKVLPEHESALDSFKSRLEERQ
jgi:hypothetical protein